MRTRLVIFTILIALALGGLPWIHGAMDDKKDDVVIYEDVLAGNPAAASGLAVKTITHMDQRLFWETDFWPGSGKDSVTEFEYVPNRRPYDYFSESQLRLSFASGNYGIGGTFSMEEMENGTYSSDYYSFSSHAQGQIWRLAVDVAKRAPKGWVEYTEVVKLKDYYEFYPMVLEMYFDDSHLERSLWIRENDTEEEEILSQYFAVPIPEDVELQITIVKDDNGNVTDIECRYTDETYNKHPYLFGDSFFTGGALMEDGGYAVLSRWEEDPVAMYTTTLNSPRLEDDYGIYFVPLVEDLEEGVTIEGHNPNRKPDVSQIRNVYPLGDGVNAVQLHHDRESDQLILLTEEAGHLWADVIDRKTMDTLQKLDLGDYSETEYISEVVARDNLILVGIQDQYDENAVVQPKRAVLLVKEAGRWSMGIRSSLNWEGQEEDYLWFNMGELTRLAWDGERLAIVQWTRYRSSCDVYVLICKDDVLQYAGVYRRRDTDGGIYDYNSMVQSWSDPDGLEIRWE